MKQKIKIYDLDYLANQELTEDDLYNIFETPSLNYSLIIAQYRHCNEYTHPDKIISLITKNNQWVNHHHFKSFNDRKKFINLGYKVIKNVYQYSDYVSKKWFEQWMFHYGFPISKR